MPRSPDAPAARLATWRDLGAGAGLLLAGALLPVLAQELLYGIAAAVLALSAAAVSLAVGRRDQNRREH